MENLQNETAVSQKPPLFRSGSHQKDLRDVFATGKVDEDFCRVLPLEYSRFDVEITRKVQMPFDGFSLDGRQTAQVPGFGDIDGKAFSPQIVGDPPSAPDQHGGCRLAGDMNEEAIIGSGSFLADFDFMGRLS
jgi:hypothetical protein